MSIRRTDWSAHVGCGGHTGKGCRDAAQAGALLRVMRTTVPRRWPGFSQTEEWRCEEHGETETFSRLVVPRGGEGNKTTSV